MRCPAHVGHNGTRRPGSDAEAGTAPALRTRRKEVPMGSILYIIGAIVVIIFVLKLLGLY